MARLIDGAYVWHAIKTASNGFSQAAVLSGLATNLAIELDAISELVRSLVNAPEEEREKYTRLYLGTALDYRAERIALQEPPETGESLTHWANRRLPQRPYVLVINRAERWSEPLARACGAFVKPLIDECPPGAHSFEITLFIGDYDYTPFGVHTDAGSIKVLHFHLGPAAKHYYVWPNLETSLLAIPLEQRYAPSEALRSKALLFRIEPGDCFFLEARQPHIAHPMGFIVSVALSLKQETVQSLTRAALHQAVGEVSQSVSDELVTNGRANLISSLPDVGLPAWIDTNLSAYIARKRSMLWFSECPQLDERELRRTDSVRICAPFDLVWTRQGNRLAAFARGVRLSLKYDTALEELFTCLCSGDEIEVGALIQRTGRHLAAEAVMGILQTLSRVRAIERVVD